MKLDVNSRMIYLYTVITINRRIFPAAYSACTMTKSYLPIRNELRDHFLNRKYKKW